MPLLRADNRAKTKHRTTAKHSQWMHIYQYICYKRKRLMLWDITHLSSAWLRHVFQNLKWVSIHKSLPPSIGLWVLDSRDIIMIFAHKNIIYHKYVVLYKSFVQYEYTSVDLWKDGRGHSCLLTFESQEKHRDYKKNRDYHHDFLIKFQYVSWVNLLWVWQFYLYRILRPWADLICTLLQR